MALHDPQPLDDSLDQATGSERPRPLATFGRYLLFRRLGRDELGEVYRAGLLGAGAIERMVLLRLFNGAEIDGERFFQACQGRIELRSSLQGGPFAEVVDSGCKNGIAFVANNLVLGRSLAEVLAQARETSDPTTLAHSLHVVDRIAIGLQNAYQVRLDGKRIIHGFLIPELVHLSSEGEVRLTGFESTGGLLDLNPTGSAWARWAGYLSPEVNAGLPPKASDDVYSLASILAELLTGEPMPALDPTEAARWVDAGVLAAEDSPLPDDIRGLLRASLRPRDERIQTAEQWHRALMEVASGDSRSSTTFDLAFFMHTLFGQALDQEAGLVEAEMQAEIPPAAPIPAAGAAAPEQASPEPEPPADLAPSQDGSADFHHGLLESAELDDGGAAPDEPAELAAPSRRSTHEPKAQAAPTETTNRRWIVVAAAAVVLAGLGAAYVVFGPPSRSEAASAPVVVAAAPSLDEATAPGPDTSAPGDALGGISEVTPPLSPEELESQVRSVVAKRASDLEANLKAEYDQRLVELRRQLDEARKAALPAPATETVAALPPAKPAPADESATGPSPAKKVPPTAVGEPPVQPGSPASVPPADALRQPAVQEGRDQIAREPEPATPEESAAPAAPEPKPVEAGSIVVNGPGVTAPALLRQPNAAYPPAAARLKREATVRVRILVDEQGKPSEIEQIGKKVGLGFDGAAMQAARTTRWTPPAKDGVPVKMWVELSIDFRP